MVIQEDMQVEVEEVMAATAAMVQPHLDIIAEVAVEAAMVEPVAMEVMGQMTVMQEQAMLAVEAEGQFQAILPLAEPEQKESF